MTDYIIGRLIEIVVRLADQTAVLTEGQALLAQAQNQLAEGQVLLAQAQADLSQEHCRMKTSREKRTAMEPDSNHEAVTKDLIMDLIRKAQSDDSGRFHVIAECEDGSLIVCLETYAENNDWKILTHHLDAIAFVGDNFDDYTERIAGSFAETVENNRS